MIRYFASHPTAANLLMVFLLVLGISTLPQLRRETLPDFSADQVQIQVIYPGATPQEVEESVCREIEDALEGINYVDEIKSEALEGNASVTVKMVEGADFRVFVDDIKNEIDALNDLPEDAETPIVKELNRADRVLSLAVTGPMSANDLKYYCEILKEKIRRLPKVSKVDVLGFSDHQIRIEIPRGALVKYGVSLKNISDTISRQNFNLPAGTMETNRSEILLRFQGQNYTTQQFSSIVILGENGGEVLLGDIAQITQTFEKDEDKAIFGNFDAKTHQFEGQRAGILQINKTKSEDSLDVVASIKKFIKNEKTPPGVRFIITQDTSSIVKDRLQMLLKNGWQGMLLVFFTMWLFFNFRFSFWVVMGLPVSFLGALFFLPFIDYSINMITMVGLLLALGLLMDDAIVISENVASHLQKGKNAINATIDGTAQVTIGVFSSFLTTVCIFGPICFMQGNIGKVMRVMPVILILVLSVSLIEAFFILPNHLSHALHNMNNSKRNRLRQRLDSFLDFLKTKVLHTVVKFAVKFNYLFIGCTVMVFLFSLSLLFGGYLKFQAFPEIDGDVVEARILLPQGSSLSQTEKVVQQITNALSKVEQQFFPQPGAKSLIRNVSIQYNKNADVKEKGAHIATVVVDLLNAEIRSAKIDDILNTWRKKVGAVTGISSLKFTEPSIGPAGLAIDVRLQGQNLNTLKQASIFLQNWLNKFKGVQDLTDDLRPGKPEIQIQLRPGATSLGIEGQNVAQQLRAAFQGSVVDEIFIGRNSFEIDVRLATQQNFNDIDNFYIIHDGTRIPLQTVADVKYTRGFAKLSRIDGLLTVSVQGDLDTSIVTSGEITKKIRKDFIPQLNKKFPGVMLSFSGEEKESAETENSLQRGFLIGLLGVFIILSFQFKSYLEPFIVMLAIPMAFIGVMWGHFLMGYSLSMPSMIGFVSLAGVVVNDSILLVEFIKNNYRQSGDIVNAAVTASQERFRAILLTSMTTIAGLIPLLMEKSLQAQVLIPLAISLVFGLLASTVLILVFVPCFYSVLYDMRKLWGNTKK
ncbi:efflux RND transporter permease subunit [Candidatus Uabimicrobium amorphum]|uniref:Acriflavin resistance protein n=1 Tax=Uabimicrobium amorphum TaxID=2596890 RepID=A0A5S9IPD7_UABAM|nr:efflux RND transporter permease subunit [Candidatus Uabimicrobium amorphum]BBM85638.1 acriflavin resistance protein [Candidatus Uabimicrobium amorphum]